MLVMYLNVTRQATAFNNGAKFSLSERFHLQKQGKLSSLFSISVSYIRIQGNHGQL